MNLVAKGYQPDGCTVGVLKLIVKALLVMALGPIAVQVVIIYLFFMVMAKVVIGMGRILFGR